MGERVGQADGRVDEQATGGGGAMLHKQVINASMKLGAVRWPKLMNMREWKSERERERSNHWIEGDKNCCEMVCMLIGTHSNELVRRADQTEQMSKTEHWLVHELLHYCAPLFTDAAVVVVDVDVVAVCTRQKMQLRATPAYMHIMCFKLHYCLVRY